MKDLRLDAQPAQQAHAADAEQSLLHTARLAVDAVKMTRDESVNALIAFDVRVEQVQVHAPDFDAPSLRADSAPAHLHLDEYRRARLVAYQLDWQARCVHLAVVLLLPTVAAQALAEVAMMIEQPDGDERQAQIARRFQVIAGEDAKPTRVKWQRCVDAELGAEVCDRIGMCERARMRARPSLRLRIHVAVERLTEARDARDISRIGRHLQQAVLADFAQHAARVMLALFPRLWIE